MFRPEEYQSPVDPAYTYSRKTKGKVTFGAFLASNLLAPRRRQFFRRCGQEQGHGKACRQKALRDVYTQQILLSDEARDFAPVWQKTCWVFLSQ